MPNITLTKEEARTLFYEGENDQFVLEAEGSWDQDYKYQFCENVYKDKNTDRLWGWNISRSGSAFSDWYYDFEESDVTLYEVEKAEKVVVYYKEVK